MLMTEDNVFPSVPFSNLTKYCLRYFFFPRHFLAHPCKDVLGSLIYLGAGPVVATISSFFPNKQKKERKKENQKQKQNNSLQEEKGSSFASAEDKRRRKLP